MVLRDRCTRIAKFSHTTVSQTAGVRVRLRSRWLCWSILLHRRCLTCMCAYVCKHVARLCVWLHLPGLSSKIKMQICSKWPICESFHPWKFPAIQCQATHLTDVKFSSSPESPPNFISQFTLTLVHEDTFPHTYIYILFVSPTPTPTNTHTPTPTTHTHTNTHTHTHTHTHAHTRTWNMTPSRQCEATFDLQIKQEVSESGMQYFRSHSLGSLQYTCSIIIIAAQAYIWAF